MLKPPKLNNTLIKSPINYNGNKAKQLSALLNVFPSDIDTFYDVFGGSGTVAFNVKAKAIVYNDINQFVCGIVNGLLSESFDSIVQRIESIVSEYSLSKTNKEGFEKLRYSYNHGNKGWIILYTLMCYSFNCQFRFNSKFEYNSSFGRNRSYFSDTQRESLRLLKEKDLSHFITSNKNFMDMDFSGLKTNDFVYLDPPYYGSTGNYNDGKRGFEGWTDEHEQYLWSLCDNLTQQGIRFAMSNNLGYENPYLTQNVSKYTVVAIDKLVYSNYHKKNTDTSTEVLIKNY